MPALTALRRKPRRLLPSHAVPPVHRVSATHAATSPTAIGPASRPERRSLDRVRAGESAFRKGHEVALPSLGATRSPGHAARCYPALPPELALGARAAVRPGSVLSACWQLRERKMECSACLQPAR